jgi:hypothetical protein
MTVMAIDTILAISALLAGMLLPAAELPVGVQVRVAARGHLECRSTPGGAPRCSCLACLVYTGSEYRRHSRQFLVPRHGLHGSSAWSPRTYSGWRGAPLAVVPRQNGPRRPWAGKLSWISAPTAQAPGQRAAESAPRHDHQRRTLDCLGDEVVIGRADRVIREAERGRVGRPVGEQVDDLQEPAALPAREPDAPADRGVILVRVCRGGIQHHPQPDSVATADPASEQVAIGAAW